MQNKSSLTEASPFDDGEMYDLICGDLDFDHAFYSGLARSARGPILDVACGTGRLLLLWAAAGLDVEGLDSSPHMLATLRRKAAERHLQARVYEADMRTFRLPRRYALIVIPFNAFIHNLTADDQLATLTHCREHLQPGGQLAFDGYFPGAALITAPDGVRVLELETVHPKTKLPIRLYDTRSFDRVKQLQHSINDIELLDATGAVTETHRSTVTLRWIYKTEMELLLRLSGFEHWKISGGFDGRALEHETDAMIVQAWKAAGSTDT